MRLFAENYKINFDTEKSYPDFPQSCPQNTVKHTEFRRSKASLDFEVPVNYCPYLLFELNKLIKKKLKTNCFQLELELFCLYNEQTFSLSISSKKGPLCLNQISFELEKYLRKLNLSNPISSLDIKIIESQKKLKIEPLNEPNYNVFSSVNFKPLSQDYYLGLVKLDLETRD